MDTYNLTYDELQKKIVQARKKKFPDDLTSLAFIRERVIIMDTRRKPEAIAAANLAFACATKSNIEYIVVENRLMEQNLQAARQQFEQLQVEVQKETPT